ncbi:MAG: hypothetical protein H0T68_00390 [Gemmatimonadales bacterium]|nr:hypothetical protein [Gemmatimonadales bacterium]
MAALMLAACGSGAPARDIATDSASTAAAEAPGDAGSGAAHVVTVTTMDYAFEAPAKIPAGLTTFQLVNNGPSLHHVQLVKLEDGKTADDFMAALKSGGHPPRWASMAGGPNPREGRSAASTTLMVEPGNYAMICFIPTADGVPHVMKGMVRPLTVTGPKPSPGEEPAADVVMKLVDFDFQLSQPLKAGQQMLRVENHGPQPHELAIVRLKSGKDPIDFAEWGMKPVGPAPGTVYGGVSGIMPGAHAWVALDLPPGDYALLCFVPEGKDGKPHFEHGMAKRVTVS